MKPQIVCDIECYKDYFLIMFLSPETGKSVAFEQYEGKVLARDKVRAILSACEVVTFNGTGYDMPMISASLCGASCGELKALSDEIIKTDIKSWQFYKSKGIPEVRVDHVDLIEVAPGMASLKIYGGRLSAPKLQDLPIEPDASITPSQREELKLYCRNDLDTTAQLLKKLTPQINLRRKMSAKYGVDLRSKSDAQIAEAVIVSEIMNITGVKPSRPRITQGEFCYKAPEFIRFDSEQLHNASLIATTHPFTVEKTGKITMPKALETLKIKIGSSTYQMGMGGLHSTEKSCFYKSSMAHSLYDWDVASYYPSIILNCGLYPSQMGEVFLKVYRQIVNDRLTAKANGDKVTADSLKICVNGSFGKLGSPYSALYAPDLMVQTTVTGQLALLMLIEKLESHGIPVVSGNTDGIVINCPTDKDRHMRLIIQWWEKQTGFVMECSEYRALYSRDVNNYVAIKDSNEAKTKGCFAFAGLQKNPTNIICTEAVIEYLRNDVPIEETIRTSRDVIKFVTVRTVKGGAVDSEGNFLGKAIRWYYADGVEGCLSYKTNGNKVPRSDGARPLMNLGEFPLDINYDWYISEAKDLLKDVGVSI